MFYSIFRTSLLHGRRAMAASQSFKFSNIKISTSLRFISISSNGHSFTVSYLINKCGFSTELASWASSYVHFETPEKPDSLFVFLENHGFSRTQILNLIKKRPRLLVCDTEKTLLPKIEYLHSLGFSRPELAKILSSYPTLLMHSLKNQIIPNFNLLRNLFHSDDKAIKAIKRFTPILVYDLESYLYPNMNVLRGIGVPESNILVLLNRQPRSLLYNPVRLKEIVEEAERMGFDPSTKMFLSVVIALKSMTKSTLEKKFDVYRRWGWSDQEIHEALRRHPLCMTVSEDKVMAIMDFLVKKMGYSSTLIAKQPSILRKSFRKNIIPRALFARELLSQGLVNDLKLSVLFDTSEKVFIRMFVDRFVNKAPELLKLYKEKLKISEKKQTLEPVPAVSFSSPILWGKFLILSLGSHKRGCSNGHSFTVSYLINKCGFSTELASRASSYVHFETPEKPDSLFVFLENHGAKLVCDTEKTLLPKIEYLHSLGFSRPKLAKILSSYPSLLMRSLKNQIIPNFNLLRNLFHSDDKAIKVIKRYTPILVYDLESYLYPNMNVLRGIGVPESNILVLLNRQPRSLLYNPVRLKEIVEEAERMGFDPSTKMFLSVVIALKSMTKSTLEKKFDVYRRWGWSDQEIHEAFRRHPYSTLIAKQPSILWKSFRKNIVPRALFARELLSQGLVNDLKLSVLFDTSEKVFIRITSFLHGRQAMACPQSFNLSMIKKSTTLRFFSNTSNQNSFTVSYLMNKCGFTPEFASFASKYVHFETPERPDSLFAFLENHGFSKTQILNLIKRRPRLLIYDTEKTLLPKLEFFYSIGFSRPELTKILTSYPAVLICSLKKQIIPSFNLLRNLFQSDDKAIKTIKRYGAIFVYEFERNLIPNMNVLRGIGVPESNILMLLNHQPRPLLYDQVRLKEIVEEVKRMGFDSSTKKFIDVVIALSSMSKSTLEKKFDVYRRWGWSDQEIHEAFQRYPMCMAVSEDKIMAVMDFLVNKMGYSSTLVAKQSSILRQSLEKRIVPRALFARELLSQGLVTDFKLSVLFHTSEKVFVDRFVNKAPDLLKLYKEKLNASEKKKELV
ncbi:hypothetical protein E1A91_D01G028100v1 [Gossypium mustelinum]|uniref:Uncharacterized protein n=1 Tax=Gossypium mustelinum TaxID=34275 RepID=A0A5D2W2P1_GOSMU|nr:hypothetical protein E1A91_D01G028100v1 [Gossypium mustelinum]